ncbi:hypothetical protein BFJ69_g16809, partial [Fusarium oxysporum]
HYSAPETRDERMLHAIDMGWFIMNKYYTMTEDVPVYSAALLLDPSKRDAYIKQNWPDEWYDNAIGGAQAIWEEEYNIELPTKPPAALSAAPDFVEHESNKLAQLARNMKVAHACMTDLNEIVSTYFSGLSTTIQNILKDALGYGDQRNLPASTLTRTDGNVNQAAMFFEEGKWLFTNDDAMGSELDNIIEQSGSFVEQRLVMQAITRKNNFILIWNSRYGEPITEKYCKERKDACKTAIWKRSAWPDTNCDITGSDMEPCHREPRRPTKDWMNKATDKYGVDMKMVIDSAIECAFNDPHEPDFKSIEVGGGVPYCFFNLPVKRGKWVLGNRVARHPETHEKFKMSKWESLDEVYKP